MNISKKISTFEPIEKKRMKAMEDFKKKSTTTEADKEIVFSKAIKAGKRIYYLDVRKNRKDEMFLAITESKKIISGEGENPQVSFEKHKIFLYKEDFEKFMHGMQDVMRYVQKEQGDCFTQNQDAKQEKDMLIAENSADKEDFSASNEIKIDIDF